MFYSTVWYGTLASPLAWEGRGRVARLVWTGEMGWVVLVLVLLGTGGVSGVFLLKVLGFTLLLYCVFFSVLTAVEVVEVVEVVWRVCTCVQTRASVTSAFVGKYKPPPNPKRRVATTARLSPRRLPFPAVARPHAHTHTHR